MFTKIPGLEFLRMADDGAAGAAKEEPVVKVEAAAGEKPTEAASGEVAAKAGEKPAEKVVEKTEVQPTWPSDWRQKGLAEAGLPTDDKKSLNMLERFTSPGDLIKKVMEQEKVITSGGHKKALTADSTPEQIAQYRKDNGIPETHDKYDLTLKDGLVIGEADKPIIDNMVKAMHGKNLDNGTVKELISAYYLQEKELIAAHAKIVSDFEKKNEDELRAAWGPEYRKNEDSVDAMLNVFSQATRDSLADARDSNGMPLKKNAAWMRDMAVLARQLNPMPHVPGSESTTNMDSAIDEMANIEKMMGDKQSDYWKGPKIDGKNTRLQARYADLVAWKERNKKA